MAYKPDCWFRTKVNVCLFKPEDCTPEKCSFYELEFSAKPIKKELDKLKRRMIELTKDAIKLRKEQKDLLINNNKKYDTVTEDLKLLIREMYDVAKGIEYLRKAHAYCKRAKL